MRGVFFQVVFKLISNMIHLSNVSVASTLSNLLIRQFSEFLWKSSEILDCFWELLYTDLLYLILRSQQRACLLYPSGKKNNLLPEMISVRKKNRYKRQLFIIYGENHCRPFLRAGNILCFTGIEQKPIISEKKCNRYFIIDK